MTSFHFHRNTS